MHNALTNVSMRSLSHACDFSSPSPLPLLPPPTLAATVPPATAVALLFVAMTQCAEGYVTT